MNFCKYKIRIYNILEISKVNLIIFLIKSGLSFDSKISKVQYIIKVYSIQIIKFNVYYYKLLHSSIILNKL